ncbi:MAG: ACP phosphodiesterase [Bacteroidales bacterium]|nr:ACP phosphodiesterase [Bacteroidales bacterium]
MNYLAHIYLSGNDRQLQVGNFIGDFVKGKSHENYPKRIQEGILLHREIDTFTDCHPIFLETVGLMRPTFGRYSGIIADMYYDYLLASDFRRYSPKYNLNCFAANFYLSTLLNYRHLPEQVKSFIFHFIGTNRLKKYASYQGLHRALQIMEHFKTNAIKPDLTIEFLKENEITLRKQFHAFMPEVIMHFK